MKELLAEVRAERRAETASKARRKRIRQLLVQVRLENPELKVVDLEKELGGFYDRATISRLTYPAVKGAAAES